MDSSPCSSIRDDPDNNNSVHSPPDDRLNGNNPFIELTPDLFHLVLNKLATRDLLQLEATCSILRERIHQVEKRSKGYLLRIA